MIVNNAGIIKDALLVKVKDGDVVGKMSLDQWQAVIDVNLTGVFLCGREGAERMIKLGNGGVIINISSISRAGNAGQTQLLGRQGRRRRDDRRLGARNSPASASAPASIAPGFTRTDLLASMPPEMLEKVTAPVPLQAARPAGGNRARRASSSPRTISSRAAASTSTAACGSDDTRIEGIQMQMQNARAIVTGGASGLGLAVAESVVAAGGTVALLDVNEERRCAVVRQARHGCQLLLAST